MKKICTKCGDEYNNHVKTSDGKHRTLNTRKVCFNCKPFKPGRPVRKSSEEKAENVLKYRKKNAAYINRIQTQYVNKRREEFRQKAAAYKGGKCSRCGYNKCLDALEFHHRNPVEKEFQISSSYTRAWIHIEKELDKCDMLCANCHREVEREIKTSSSSDG